MKIKHSSLVSRRGSACELRCLVLPLTDPNPFSPPTQTEIYLLEAPSMIMTRYAALSPEFHILVEMDDEDQVGGGKHARGMDLWRVSLEELSFLYNLFD